MKQQLKNQLNKVMELAEIHQSIMTFDDNWKRRDEALWREIQILDKMGGVGVTEGKHIKFGVADGYAHYIITKVLKNVVHVVHVPYCDNYHAVNSVYDDGKGNVCVPRPIVERRLRMLEWQNTLFGA